jgi:hypothetical protein
VTIEQLWRRLRGEDPLALARRAMVVYDLAEGAYELHIVGRPARVFPKEAAALWTDVQPAEALKPMHLRIALTYLLTATSGQAAPGRWEPAAMPEAAGRALLAAFGRDAASLIRATRRLGGRRDQGAEHAAELPLLPLIRARIILPDAGDASGPACTCQWNRGAGGQLPADAAAALLDLAVTRLIAAAQ